MFKLIFDVDGTLTPAREKIDPIFAQWFNEFQIDHHCYMITGSDIVKTIEQLGSKITWDFNQCFSCAGNEIWLNENWCTYRSVWTLPTEVKWILYSILESDPYHIRTGNHLEERVGLANFSVLGRNATDFQRKNYAWWDQMHMYRERYAKQLNDMFPSIQAEIGGQISIDIIEKGKDKSQIISQFHPDDKLIFFGNQICPGGNDYSLAMKIKEIGGTFYNVNNWKETWELLRDLDQKTRRPYP